MRMIGQLDSETDAKRFSDYLLTVDVDAHIEESASGAWQVWIEHDDDLDKGTAELAAFRASPNDPKYGSAKTAAAKIRREEEKAAERRRKNFRDVRTSAAFSGTARHATPVAVTMIVISLVVFALQWNDDTRRTATVERTLSFQAIAIEWEGEAPTPDAREIAIRDPGESMWGQVADGQVWRLLTPMFLHFGILHIFLNMSWLWRLGQVIEGIKGSGRFALLVIAVALISNNAQAVWNQWDQELAIFGGMSGVVAGLFGYAWMKTKFQAYERILVTDQEVGMMIGWLVICSFGWVGPIANAAHWGGLFSGMAIGAGPWLWRRVRRMGR